MSIVDTLDIVVGESELQSLIDGLAENLAGPMQTGSWTLVSILIGATPFTTDLMRALSRRSIHPVMDVIWLESYRDARESSGRVVVRADISRPLQGQSVLLVDDVFDTGRTLAFAKAHLLAKGADRVLTCCLTQKPSAPRGEDGVDFCAFDSPARYLVGYGMDDAGRYRGLPYIGAIPTAE